MTEEAATEISKIDAPYNPNTAGEIVIAPGKGVLIESMPQMIEAAKLMARSDICVPPHCRNEPGVCFAVIYKANALGLKDPFFVAEHSYVVEQSRQVGGSWDKVKTLAFDSTIFHAAVEVSGILMGPLRCEYEGDGVERTCTVFGTFRGQKEPHLLTSPALGKVHPGYNDKGYVKGSPLWDKDPDQQLFYWTVRNWARRYCPQVVGGIYDKDEYEETPLDPRDVTPASPKLLDRLPGRAQGEGFSGTVVEDGLREEAALEEAKKVDGAKKSRRRQSAVKPQGDETGDETKSAKAGVKEPSTADEYVHYAQGWIAEGVNSDSLRTRWKNERGMREALTITPKARMGLERALDARIDEIEG